MKNRGVSMAPKLPRVLHLLSHFTKSDTSQAQPFLVVVVLCKRLDGAEGMCDFMCSHCS